MCTLSEIDKGSIENSAAPMIAIEYRKLAADATLRDVVIAVCKDEENHRDVNHFLSDQMADGFGISRAYKG